MNKMNDADALSRWKARADAKLNGDFLSIETYSGYRMAIADSLAGEILLKVDATDEEIGLAILESLSKSRFLSFEEEGCLFEENKQNYISWIQKLSRIYGYRSKKAMFKEMRMCNLCKIGNLIQIEPNNHEKLEGWGGSGITEADYVRIPADSTPAEIGAALRLAFSRCTGMGT